MAYKQCTAQAQCMIAPGACSSTRGPGVCGDECVGAVGMPRKAAKNRGVCGDELQVSVATNVWAPCVGDVAEGLGKIVAVEDRLGGMVRVAKACWH